MRLDELDVSYELELLGFDETKERWKGWNK